MKISPLVYCLLLTYYKQKRERDILNTRGGILQWDFSKLGSQFPFAILSNALKKFVITYRKTEKRQMYERFAAFFDIILRYCEIIQNPI